MDFENVLKLKVIFSLQELNQKIALQWFDLQGNLSPQRARRNKFSFFQQISKLRQMKGRQGNDLACE